MNPGLELDLGWLNEVNINFDAIKERSSSLLGNKRLEKDYVISWLLKALTCLDLTTLGGDDTCSNVHRLCLKAANPLDPRIIQTLGLDKQNIFKVRCAAVCVYPTRVADAHNTLESLDPLDPIPIAADQFIEMNHSPNKVKIEQELLSTSESPNPFQEHFNGKVLENQELMESST